MDNIILMDVDKLTPHPRNAEFFDDIEGTNWEEFKESIRTSGVIAPIIITQDNIVVSGHQRIRACKELGIAQVPCYQVYFKSEDEILQALIETNIRQRGLVGGSRKKVAKRIEELERIYGIEHGGDRRSEDFSSGENSRPKNNWQRNWGFLHGH